jgi:hypothetical protein
MRATEAGAWSGMRLNKRLCAALRSANPRRRFSAAARWFTAARMMLLIVPLGHGKRRHRERQHRGNGNYAQHFDLSFFFNLRSTRRGQQYQSPRGSVTRHARWKVDT